MTYRVLPAMLMVTAIAVAGGAYGAGEVGVWIALLGATAIFVVGPREVERRMLRRWRGRLASVAVVDSVSDILILAERRGIQLYVTEEVNAPRAALLSPSVLLLALPVDRASVALAVARCSAWGMLACTVLSALASLGCPSFLSAALLSDDDLVRLDREAVRLIGSSSEIQDRIRLGAGARSVLDAGFPFRPPMKRVRSLASVAISNDVAETTEQETVLIPQRLDSSRENE